MIKRVSSLFITWFCLSTNIPTVCSDLITLSDLDEDDGTELKVLIGYKPQADEVEGFSLRMAQQRRRRKRFRGLARVHAVQASLNRTMIRELQKHDEIIYIEEDPPVQMLREIQTVPLELINALSDSLPTPSSSDSGACSDPDSFKIGIVDSGLDVNHPDIPCFNMGTSRATCIGAEFGIAADEFWDQPETLSHGTMVAGIIGAIRGNNEGISGVVGNANVCYVIARVFGDSGMGTADLSSILEGIDWVYDQGAKVINLSLGGPSTALTAQNLYQTIRDNGVLLIAAAGNDGTSTKSYPASYSSCISVAAVDDNLDHAAFSQFNDAVDIAAPGVNVLSTAPLGLSALASMAFSDSTLLGSFMINSPRPTSSISGPLVTCPSLGRSTCPGRSGQVCLIERGEILFEEKALNCEAGGGIAAIVYNNVDFDLVGASLSTPTAVTIPVISVSLQTGLSLLSNYDGETVTINFKDGYEFADGTSFSAPFVTGGAALVWQACPRCSADDIEQCLLEGAMDLGTRGVDVFYGHGLLQVDQTYSCLVNTVECCDPGNGAQVPTPSQPTSPRTPSPVAAPAPTDTQDCSAAEEAYSTCFDNQLTFWQEEICRYCVNAAVPTNLRTISCSAIEGSLCPAILNTCAVYCGSCSQPIESFMRCAVRALRNDCTMDCSFGPSDANNEAPGSPETSTDGKSERSIGLIGGGNEPDAQSGAPTKPSAVAAIFLAGWAAWRLII